jgi:hypothetical protein
MDFHGGSREERLARELKNDSVKVDRDQIEQRAAWEQSDLIRIQIDDRLKNNFPALPRTELDQLADQLDSRLRVAKSGVEAQKAIDGLKDLHNYILSLNANTEPSKDLFARNVSGRLRLLKTPPVVGGASKAL